MKFKKNAEIITSDFFYDLFSGGYIKPEELLADKEEAKKVKEAMAVLKKFYDSAEEQEIINWL